MSSSEEYLERMAMASGDWAGAIREFAAWHGSKAADVLAAAEGTSRRTAERWIAKATNKINPKTGRPSQASTPKPMQQVNLVNLAKRHRAARKIRAAKTVNAGTAVVSYEGATDPRTRHINVLPVTGSLAVALQIAADYVADGLYADAGAALNKGVLDAYGVPEDTLEIVDYVSGLTIQ